VEVFAKAARPDVYGSRCLAAEVAGLRWLAEPGVAQVAEVVIDGPGAMATRWIEPGQGDIPGAEDFGRQLARLHQAGAASFGAPWPGCIGPLPQSNRSAPDWASFYGGERLEPACDAALDAGALTPEARFGVLAVIDALGELAGPAEPPSRIHGDLWSGNVVWAEDGGAWIVDPAAHGGHRETDLAMLALFGVRYLERILAAYQEEYPLAAGWRRRVGLHQLHPLLVHAVLFGPSYGRRVADITAELLNRRK
jgi:fructosamine-3-kinase